MKLSCLCALCKVSFCQKIQKTKTTAKKSKQPAVAGAAPKINGRPNGRITGKDMRHLLLLLPFLLFELLEDEIEQNNVNAIHLINPCHQLIAWVLILLEWYHLYRRSVLVNKFTYTRTQVNYERPVST